MASTVEARFSLTRGKPVSTSLTATGQVVQFTISHIAPGHVNGLDTVAISVQGGTSTSGLTALECSIDGGTSWFEVARRTVVTSGGSTAANLYTASSLNSDAVVVDAAAFDISGLQAGGIFRIGVLGISAGTAVVTLLGG